MEIDASCTNKILHLKMTLPSSLFGIIYCIEAVCEVFHEEIEVIDDALVIDNLPDAQLARNVKLACGLLEVENRVWLPNAGILTPNKLVLRGEDGFRKGHNLGF